MTIRPIFRSTAWDAVPAGCGVAILAFILWTFACFHTLTAWLLVPAFVAIAFSYCWNLQCISHNFIHNPFFVHPWINRAFSVVATLTVGVPQTIYHHYHLNHHFGDNDKKGANGTTKDWSSIYRHGVGDEPEAFWRYCLLSFFRVELGAVVRVVVRRGRGEVSQLVLESAALCIFWLTMALCNWRYFLFFYVPSYYLGWVLSYAEGYLEHFGAKPGNPLANSVSSYNWLYNLLWLNNGYHQEHHWDPRAHWTAMRDLHHRLRHDLVAQGTRTLKGPHLTALLEDYWTRRSQTAPADTRRAA
jgi:fatty acid desaturase